MYLLKKIIGFYNSGENHWALLLLIAWLFWPGSFFLVGIIFESRIPPIWEYQSKAFFPGDLVFGIIFVCLISMLAKMEPDSLRRTNVVWLILLLLVTAVIARYVHELDISNYPLGSRHSPTKIWHNLIGFFVIPVVLIWLSIVLFAALTSPKNTVQASFIIRMWEIIAVCIFFYIVCQEIDIRNGYDTATSLVRHPDNWKPIWTLLKKGR